jgi:DNA adenine methylase
MAKHGDARKGYRSYIGPKSPTKRFGGKHFIAPKIAALLPPRTVYVEPYFGTGAVMFALDPEGVAEIINDLEHDLTLFWMGLQNPDAFRYMCGLALRFPVSETLWKAADTYLAIAPPEPSSPYWEMHPESLGHRAFMYFVHVRQSLGGRGESFAPFSKRRTRGGMLEQASAWLGAIDKLEPVHHRLQRVGILGARPALGVIQQYDGEGVLYYLDPPYLHTTRKGGGYRHEMTLEDHRDLLDTIKQCKGHVAISGYPSQLYDGTLSGWNRHQWDLPNNVSHAEQKGREVECLWCNF